MPQSSKCHTVAFGSDVAKKHLKSVSWLGCLLTRLRVTTADRNTLRAEQVLHADSNSPTLLYPVRFS